MSVLYVDDDVDDHEIFREAVTTIGAQVDLVTCSTAAEAKSVIAKKHFDYVFIDYRMPIADGKSILPFLEAMIASSGTKAIMFSTFMSEQEEEQCLKAGAELCFTKTGNFNTLCDLLRKYLV